MELGIADLKPFLPGLEDALDDDAISELMINGPGAVFVERAGRMAALAVPALTAEVVARAAIQIARPLRLDPATTPIIDARLADGSRDAICSPPAAPSAAITIRRFGGRAFTIGADGERVAPAAVAAASGAALRSGRNVLISGGTGSGKTTLLNALVSLLPAGGRVISIEDTLELRRVRGADHPRPGGGGPRRGRSPGGRGSGSCPTTSRAAATTAAGTRCTSRSRGWRRATPTRAGAATARSRRPAATCARARRGRRSSTSSGAAGGRPATRPAGAGVGRAGPSARQAAPRLQRRAGRGPPAPVARGRRRRPGSGTSAPRRCCATAACGSTTRPATGPVTGWRTTGSCSRNGASSRRSRATHTPCRTSWATPPGTPARLNRDTLVEHDGLGSESSAREELRAEIAAMMAGERLGVGHEPRHGNAYVDSWLQALRNDRGRSARRPSTRSAWRTEWSPASGTGRRSTPSRPGANVRRRSGARRRLPPGDGAPAARPGGGGPALGRDRARRGRRGPADGPAGLSSPRSSLRGIQAGPDGVLDAVTAPMVRCRAMATRMCSEDSGPTRLKSGVAPAEESW